MFKPITREYLDFLETVVEEAAKVHRQIRSTIDFSKKNKPHAFYLIQGGCITNAFISIELARLGYQNTVFQVTRLIHESRELMQYFEILPDNDRKIDAWFEGEIIHIPMARSRPRKKPNRKEEERIKRKTELSGHSIEKQRYLEKAARILFDKFSKSEHVTMEAINYNMNEYTHEFDYLCRGLQYKGYKTFTLGVIIVILMLQCLILFPEITPVSPENRKLLRKLIDDVYNVDMSL